MTGPGDDRDDVWEPLRNADDGDDGSTGSPVDPDPGDGTAAGSSGNGSGDPGSGESAGAPGDGGSAGTTDRETGSTGSARPSGDHGSDGDGRPRAAGRPGSDPPDPEPGGEEEYANPVVWFFESDSEGVVAAREVMSTVGLVVLLGVVLFGTSGIWPPLVAVESGSMEPHMYKGDLVFVVENGRFAPDESYAGVVTYRQGNPDHSPGGTDGPLAGYWSFGSHGNVIVFEPDGREGTPIIHRAQFYVEEGENWYDEADPQYIRNADNCEELRACPAPHDGFITKGDNNPYYDQVRGRTTVVRPEWVRGVAKVRVPWLGCVRLQLSGNSCF